jgi:transcriptional regulator with XRE-family HTH domain
MKNQHLPQSLSSDELIWVQKELLVKGIVRARKRQQMSQNELAEATGIRRNNISFIESGRANPTIETLLRISVALQISLVIND